MAAVEKNDKTSEVSQTSEVLSVADDESENEHAITWHSTFQIHDGGDPVENWLPRRDRILRALERVALFVERGVNALVGSTQLNPFYHTGVIAVFLLVVVTLTGVLISFYYQFSFSGAYLSVARIEGHIVMRVMRALHRYASEALIIASLLHAYRTFFMARFKGARWLAWVTGVVMTGVLWFVGVTGYALVWDTRGQTIIARFTEFLKSFSTWGATFAAWFLYLEKTNQGWVFFGVLLLVHILLTLAVGGFLWLHVVRLNRPSWFPKNYWLIGLTFTVILVSIFAPVGMLPRAQLTQLPTLIQFDPIFLFYLLPRGDWILVGVAVVSVIAALIPWLWFHQKKSPRIIIDKDRCTGCTKCAVDCPYNAIQMIPRNDDSAHKGSPDFNGNWAGTLSGATGLSRRAVEEREKIGVFIASFDYAAQVRRSAHQDASRQSRESPHKLIAIENQNLCVSCGVCLGSCDGLAVSLDDLPVELLWNSIQTRLALAKTKKVIFTCERHARDTFNGDAAVIALPCVASAHPDLIARTLDSGASQVQIVGCPPNDCAQREGNVWQEERLIRQRLPKLKRAYEDAPITRLWLPPNEKLKPSGSSVLFPKLTARNYVAAFALIAVALTVQMLATNLFTRPYASQLANAQVQVILANPARPFGTLSDLPASRLEEFPTDLILEVDGKIIFEKPASARDLFSGDLPAVFETFLLAAGDHHLRLSYQRRDRLIIFLLFERDVTLHGGEILIIAPD